MAKHNKSDKLYQRFNFRIYPTSSQVEKMRDTSDACRFVWNYFLGKRSLLYRTQLRSMNYYNCANELPLLKKVFPWLVKAESTSLQECLQDLQQAFVNFFENHAGYPEFKFKKHSHINYRCRYVNNNISLVDDKHIKLPRLGTVRIRLSKQLPGKIANVTIMQRPSGKFFVSITCEVPDITRSNQGMELGLDLGLHDLYTLSNGNKTPNHKFLAMYQKQLARQQRRLSRRKPGSFRYQKQRFKVARLHENIANTRMDYLHQESTKLARLCSILCIEDLNIKGMSRNPYLSKAILDAGWGMFIRMLEYKLSQHGGKLIKVPRFYASSQTCHICGHKYPKTKDLSVRGWTCPECGEFHDRDINAAINILHKGLEILPQLCNAS